MDRMRGDALRWNVVPLIAAPLLAFVLIWRPSLQTALLALIVLAVIIWRPVAVPVAALLVAQEINPENYPDATLSLTLGHQMYFGSLGVAPIAMILAGAAASCTLVILTRSERSRPLTAAGISVFSLSLALAAIAAFAGLYSRGSLMNAVNQGSRPFLLIACGLLVGLAFHELPSEPQATTKTAVGALLGLAAVGTVTIASGRAGSIGGANYFAFYDAALPAVAAAVVLALLVYPHQEGSKVRMVVGIAALAIVIISFRRNVWVAAVVVLVVALLLARGRGKLTGRLLVAVAALVPVAFLLPGLATSAGTRIRDTFYLLSSDGARDVSTQGHVNDLHIGWTYVKSSPWWGIGPEHTTLPGLAAQGPGRLYIHNEWLLDWLRFGFLGVALITVIFLILIKRAVVTLRAGDRVTLPETVAAMFVLLVPICSMTAPFISTTNRWPALLGIAAGLIAVGKKTAVNEASTESSIQSPEELLALRQ
jgi:O-antigen ligase